MQQLDAWEALDQTVRFRFPECWHRDNGRRTAQTRAAEETPEVSVPEFLRSRTRTRRRRRKRGWGGSWASLRLVYIYYQRFRMSYVSG
jgi:hypothetical protein